ncbi:golgin subfamily A member 6-like protein 25 [Macrobrachium rosenbergii]|uniref:golgin subfamily A member 6-like protein 25 n=1 Tax=Macrobrachium rosenbergii TaxID=79674 RepID=UPI0034D66D17
MGSYVDVQDHTTGLWNRPGVVVGIGSRRDYLIKMGSGRILWRNRKFLRPHRPFLPIYGSSLDATDTPSKPKDVEKPRDNSTAEVISKSILPTPAPRRSLRHRKEPDRLQNSSKLGAIVPLMSCELVPFIASHFKALASKHELIDDGSHQEEILFERNEGLAKDLTEERYRVDELFKVIDEYEARLRKTESENEELRKKNENCQDAIIQRNQELDDLKEQLKEKGAECATNAEVIQDLRNEITDNDVYCGFLEEKVKHHEGERKKMKQKLSDLEGNLQELQKEGNVLLDRNSDLRNNLEREAQNNLAMEKKMENLEHQNERLRRDLTEKESEIVASMETLSLQKGKNEILAEEVLVMKNWITELAGEKEKLNDLLVEKALKISSVRQHMEDEKEKNHVLAEEGKVLKNWIAELAGENASLKDRLAEKEMEENAMTKVSEMLEMTKEKVSELESTLRQVQERLNDAEENECEQDKEDHSQEADAPDEVNEVEAEFTKVNEGHSEEENGEIEDLERETGNQEDLEVAQEKKESCEEEGTKLENEESPKNNEENNQRRTKKKRGKKRKKPARQEDSRSSVVQSVALQTHSENLHSIMLPAEFQEVLQKKEKGLAFITYKNKVLLNFMHHDKAFVRAVLSRCSRSTAEEVLVDLQKLVLSALTKD